MFSRRSSRLLSSLSITRTGSRQFGMKHTPMKRAMLGWRRPDITWHFCTYLAATFSAPWLPTSISASCIFFPAHIRPLTNTYKQVVDILNRLLHAFDGILNYLTFIPLPLLHRSRCPVACRWLYLLLQSERGFDRSVEQADVVSVFEPLAASLASCPDSSQLLGGAWERG